MVKNLSLKAKTGRTEDFIPIVRTGFFVKTRPGSTVRDCLCEDAGLPEQYLENNIQTIFLDANVVDDANASRIKAGSEIALSAAMPGIAGAAFRKRGRVAAMRPQITSAPQDPGEAETGRPAVEEFVLVKLYNIVAAELGPWLLRRGVLVGRERLAEFFLRNGDVFRNALLAADLDGVAVAVENLASGAWMRSEHIFLRVYE